ncbi:hypothetical protein NHQ30_005147 [Ciborinia camelliae]|nr:hypothetical protein NHQ30_005147 [Ciborinia camelliae]
MDSSPEPSDTDMSDATTPSNFIRKPSNRRCMPKGAKSLTSMCNRARINHLKEVIPSSNYCCGGSIPIRMMKTSESRYSGVTIRYDDSMDSGLSHKVLLPSPMSKPMVKIGDNVEFSSQGIEDLAQASRPSGTLLPSRFSTDFDPASHGILDAIGNILLPDYGKKLEEKKWEYYGVRAELCGLNVLQPCLGTFYLHINIGGELLVSQQYHTSTFDWSTNNIQSPSPSIEWTAFYQTCTHTYLPIKSGNCITLSYNLLLSKKPSIYSPTISSSHFPLFEGIREMLNTGAFMPEGGLMGYYCTHNYEHTTSGRGGIEANVEEVMPYALKGVDAMIFQTFSGLGMMATVRPVIENDLWSRWAEVRMGGYDEDTYELYEDDKEWCSTIQNRTRVGKKFWGLAFCGDDGPTSYQDPSMSLLIITPAQTPIILTKQEEKLTRETPIQFINSKWPYDPFKDINWLNKPNFDNWRRCLVHTKLNESDFYEHYSHAAILIDIPPRNERRVEIPENGYSIDPSKYQRKEEEK